MANMLSGKVKKIPSTSVSADRYNFLKLSEAEPDLGVPLTSGYVLSSDTAGNRIWVNPTNASISTLTIGTGLSGTSYNGSTAVTIAIDSTVVTLTGTQTLTNKTIAAGSNTITGLTNSNLSGTAGITNANLANSSVTIGTTAVSLGSTVTTFAGLTSVSSTTFVGALTGNASTATSAATLTTPRAINGVNFDGSAAITITSNTTNALTIGTGLSGTSFNGSAAVTIALASGYGDTLNPYASKTANYVLAAPNGAAGVPSFRALVAADIPTLNQNTTGSAASLSATLGIGTGGTGQTTAATAFNALSPVTTLGDLIYGSAANTNSRLAGNITATKNFLVQTGTGTLSAAPVWGTIAAADVPTLNQNTTGSAATLTTARTINGVSFNGSANITLTAANSNALTISTGLSGTSYDGSGAVTIAIDSTVTTLTGTQTLTNKTLTSPAVTTSLTTGSTSFDLINTTATTVNFAGAATTLSIGAATGTLTINNANTVITGNLTVNGTTTTVNSTTITVDDINIELGSIVSPTDVTAAGGGITLKGATDKTISWSATNGWTSSEDFNVASGKIYRINGTSVLSGTTLGSGVTGSSLTSVGTITSGTWSSSFGAVSGANLTSLTAGNLSGTIPSTVLANSTVYIGTTAVALNRATANLALTGILSTTYAGSTSGTTVLIPAAVAGTTTITMPAATGTMALTSDIPTVNAGTLGASAGTAGATNTTVALNFSAAYNANSASNVTINPVVGPAITNLATLMTTAGAGFIKRGATADTYTIDTNTYLTANQSISLTGDITGTGTTSIATTLATVNSNLGTFNNITINSKGLATAGSNVAYLTSVVPANFASQTANTVLAAPSGSAGTPTFRALVALDIPTLNQNTTGSAGSVSNILTIGTGLSGTSYNGSAAVTVALANTTVTAGSYTAANITVDAQGRITAASNGATSGSWLLKTANYTAVDGDNIIADTTAGAFTITLPATAVLGTQIKLADGNSWATTNLTVARNGKTIKGLAENLTVDVAGIKVDLLYNGSTWLVFAFATPTIVPSAADGLIFSGTTTGIWK